MKLGPSSIQWPGHYKDAASQTVVPTSPVDAAKRVRKFVTARRAHFDRIEPYRSNPDAFLTPGHIAAEYGSLFMADLLALCDEVEAR